MMDARTGEDDFLTKGNLYCVHRFGYKKCKLIGRTVKFSSRVDVCVRFSRHLTFHTALIHHS